MSHARECGSASGSGSDTDVEGLACVHMYTRRWVVENSSVVSCLSVCTSLKSDRKGEC